MSKKGISTSKIVKILGFYSLNRINKSQISKTLKISRQTVSRYISLYEHSDLTYIDLLLLKDKDIVHTIYPKQNISDSLVNLIQLFPEYHQRLCTGESNLKQLWIEYLQAYPSGYKYSRFIYHYHNWCQQKSVKEASPSKWQIVSIEPTDLKLLKKWRSSTERNKWEKAVALLGLYRGENISDISKKIERSRKTIKKWSITYREKGLSDIDLRRTRKVSDEIKEHMRKKSDNLIKLLHESPSIHNINRTSWSLDTLSKAYKEQYGESISSSTISEYIRARGYSFKKAKVVLTSPDPDYREKLNNIKQILSGLKEKEKFFSIDEFGPFAIKIQGGRTYTPNNQKSTVPQFQMSKGSLICTAALELSTNQITHFYSDKKNTTEMIRLLMIILDKYNTEDKIYFSWDAASWHASKELYKKVDMVNESEYRELNNTPAVKLAPLPSSAQFLNVIESVFSGMAKAVIHNSNYQTIDECKNAIDRYFDERNQAFIENPKRAGKKIWGDELVKPQFSESNNCKDPKYR